MNMQQQIEHLKQSQLTQVLADGFAELYHNRPQFPVSYLASYLKNYNKTKYMKQSLLVDKLTYNKNICAKLQGEEESVWNYKKQQEVSKKELQDEIINYLKSISDTQYHCDILEGFCTWVQDNYMLTGAYMGKLKSKKKQINLEVQDSEQAHFQLEGEKLIYFQAASRSHSELLKGKTLQSDSVLGKLLNAEAGSNEGEQQPPEDGEEAKGDSRPKDQIYFPSVVDNQELKFFRFPRLGAFYGLGIKIKSYLSEQIFQSNASKIQTFQKASQQYEKEHQQRQTKFREVYDEKANSGAQEQELEELEKQFENQEKQFPKPTFPQLQAIEKKFVFGFDTLGQDRQIPIEDQKKIREHVQFLKEKWESRQLQILKNDIDQHLKLADKLESPPIQIFTKLIEDQDKELPSHEEVEKYKQNQKLMELETDVLRIQKLKQYISEQKYLPFLEEIVTAKILRFKEIIKYWLIFCLQKKEDINIPGSNVLDIRKARNLINKKTFVQKINQYNPRGSKSDITIENYAKWERMQANLQKIDINAVVTYNIYLAFILRFLILVSKVRQGDRAKRINIMQEERQNRREKVKENRGKKKIKKQKLKIAKAQAAEKQDQEQFNEAAWQAHYFETQQNQLLEVGINIPDEIDKDLQNGEQIFDNPIEKDSSSQDEQPEGQKVQGDEQKQGEEGEREPEGS